jgi:hypothetical protein
MKVQKHDDVGFVPDRLVPATIQSVQATNDDLTVATATTLVTEYGECPSCNHDIQPDVGGGVQSDRDVIWTDESSSTPGRCDIDRSSSHECGGCGADLRILVEEKAKPARWSEISSQRWAKPHTWIETQTGDYLAVNTNAIMISEEHRSE